MRDRLSRERQALAQDRVVVDDRQALRGHSGSADGDPEESRGRLAARHSHEPMDADLWHQQQEKQQRQQLTFGLISQLGRRWRPPGKSPRGLRVGAKRLLSVE